MRPHPAAPVQAEYRRYHSGPRRATADGPVGDLTAPLVSGAPLALDVSIPCPAVASPARLGRSGVRHHPGRAVVDATRLRPVRAGHPQTPCFVAFRDAVAAVAPRAAVSSGACSTLQCGPTPAASAPTSSGSPARPAPRAAEKTPAGGRIFTDLGSRPMPRLSARVDIDTRFISKPTALKAAVMDLGLLSVLTRSALAVLDRRTGHRVRHGRRRFWRVGPAVWIADVAVVGGLRGVARGRR